MTHAAYVQSAVNCVRRPGTRQGTLTQSTLETSHGYLRCMATPTPVLQQMSGTK